MSSAARKLVPDNTLKGGDIQLTSARASAASAPRVNGATGATPTSVPATTSTTRGATPAAKGAQNLAC